MTERTMTKTSKKLNIFRLDVMGVFGRNRKQKFEMFQIAEIETHFELPENVLNTLVENKLKEIKVKNGCVKVTVHEEAREIQTYSDGVVMHVRQMQCVTPNCLKSFNIVDGESV